MTKDRPIATFVGSGGHGMQAFLRFITNRAININVILTTMDWGGSSGRELKGVLPQLYAKLGIDQNKDKYLVPQGDLRNNLANLFEYMGHIDLAHLMQLRISFTQEAEMYLHNLVRNLNIQDRDFVDYLMIHSLDYFTLYKKRYEEKDISLGNMVLNILRAYTLRDELEQDFDMLIKDIFPIPENITFTFASKTRQTLIGVTETGEIVVGEDVIDDYPEQFIKTFLLPDAPDTILEQLNIVNNPVEYLEKNQCSIDHFSSKVISMISESTLLIKSTGSLTNNINLFKTFSQVIKEHSKPVLSLINLVRRRNELPVEDEIRQFQEMLGDSIHFLLPKPVQKPLPTNAEIILGKYVVQGKDIQVPFAGNGLVNRLSQLFPNLNDKIHYAIRIVGYLSQEPLGDSQTDPLIRAGLRHDLDSVDEISNEIVEKLFQGETMEEVMQEIVDESEISELDIYELSER